MTPYTSLLIKHLFMAQKKLLVVCEVQNNYAWQKYKTVKTNITMNMFIIRLMCFPMKYFESGLQVYLLRLCDKFSALSNFLFVLCITASDIIHLKVLPGWTPYCLLIKFDFLFPLESCTTWQNLSLVLNLCIRQFYCHNESKNALCIYETIYLPLFA